MLVVLVKLYNMNENPILKFELTLNEANVVLNALQELPAKICNPLSEKITTQAKAQIEALQATEAVEVGE